MAVCKNTIQTHPPSPPHETDSASKSIRQLLEEEIAWLTERRKQLSERLLNLTQESEAFIANLEKIQ